MNINREKLVLPACLFGVFLLWISGSAGTFIPNLTEKCYRCLCYVASKCNLAQGCEDGYCGPFNISKVYWVDAGKVVLPDDETERKYAWRDCARNYNCAKKIIEGYLENFGKDCNGDGVTNCMDYIMININGGYGCSTPLENTQDGRIVLNRYKDCTL